MVSFSDTRGVGVAKTVCVSSVVTEQEFIGKSHDFESSISQGKYQDVCEQKINSCSAESEKNVWNFLKVSASFLVGVVSNVGSTHFTELVVVTAKIERFVYLNLYCHGNISQVAFEENPRRQYLKLLGYDMEELEKKVCVSIILGMIF